MTYKGLNKMTTKMMEDVDKIKSGFELGSRVGVTQLGRSTKWREDLERYKAMEVVERNNTAGVLLKPESFKALLTYLEQLEQELEQAQVEALFKDRGHLDNWLSGDELATKTKSDLQKREKHIRRFLDGNQ